MQAKNIRRARIAAIALAPALAFATPSLASAAGPGESQQFEQTRTTTDRNGVHSSTSQSCVGQDGEVSYQRDSGLANANGKSESTTNSGANAACDNSDIGTDGQRSSAQNSSDENSSVGNAASDRVGSAGTSPLIVVNTPPAG